jgi:hypothetical protein
MDFGYLLSKFWYIIVLISGYCFPLFIAIRRQHPKTMAIGAVNIFLGWTVIGWLCSLVWSLTGINHPLRKETILNLAE